MDSSRYFQVSLLITGKLLANHCLIEMVIVKDHDLPLQYSTQGFFLEIQVEKMKISEN